MSETPLPPASGLVRRRWGLGRFLLVGFVGATMLLGLLTTVLFVSLWFPTDPPRPTAKDLEALASQFPSRRAALDSLAALEVERWRLDRGGRGAAYHREIAQRLHETWELKRGIRARAGFSMDGQSWAESDSLVWIRITQRRGRGFGAGWAYGGYIRAARDPADRTAWLPGRPFGGTKLVHLDGDWYAYTEFQPTRGDD